MAERPEQPLMDELEERIYQAFDTLRRTPADGPRRYSGGSSWPTIIRGYWEAYGMNAARVRRPPPGPSAIADMETVLGWMTWLGANYRMDMKCVFLCCGRGLEPKQAGDILGLHRNTVRRHRDDGLARMVQRFMKPQGEKAA
jgi:hypothetical protein